MNKRDFLKKIRLHLKQHGFKLVFHKTEYVDNSGFRCAGVFHPSSKKLEIGQGHPRWFETIVHEYGHFLQYIERNKLWVNYCLHGRSWWKKLQ